MKRVLTRLFFAILPTVVACLILFPGGAEAINPQVAAGAYHSVAIKGDGTLWSWGLNANGQLGDGTTTDRHYPKQVGSDHDWSLVSAGFSHTVAIKSDGSLWAWGTNGGRLGDGTTEDKLIPARTGLDNDWATIAAGAGHTVAIKSNGTLWAWGSNNYGECGIWPGYLFLSPMQIGSSNDWSKVAAGDSYTIALKTDGSLWAWGSNSGGRLGTGVWPLSTYLPQRLGSDNDWAAIAAGPSHAIALKADGSLWSWGDGTYTPARVGSDVGWAKVAAGSDFNAALKSDGSLWTWGDNEYGQLGTGTSQNPVPARVGTDSWATVAAGSLHALALRDDQTLWSWGYNSNGQVGDATTINKSIPTRIGVLALRVTKFGAGGGEITSSPSGIACGSTCSFLFQSGETVSLTAVPDSNSLFAGWMNAWFSADCPVYGVCSVVMDQVQTVGALFIPIPYNLSVTKAGTGDGIVASTPSGISCGATCSSTFNSGTSITLTATPDVNSTFTGWSGGACSGTGPCTVSLTSDQSVTATFTAIPYDLSVVRTGPGTVTSSPSGIDCGSNCSSSFHSGTMVTLTATPDMHSNFIGWAGSCTGTAPCTVSMTSARSVTAVFAETFYTLAVTKAGAGNGTVTSAPTGISCGTTCSSLFHSGTSVTLTATPEVNSTFAGWANGGCSGTGTCTVTMEAARNVTAVFTKTTYTLAVTKAGAGNGTVASAPAGISCGTACSFSFDSGTSVTLTATPDAESTFTGWSGGGCTGTGPCSVVMSEAKSIAATFTSSDHGSWTSLVAGWDYTAALKTDGSLWVWGDNRYGQLGNGTSETTEAPGQIAPGSRWMTVAAGEWHVMAIKTDGSLWGWGRNVHGQLGDGTLQDRNLPVEVAPGATWRAVSAGDSHTVAIKSDGTLWAWGWGVVVDGTVKAISTPTQIGRDSDWAAVSAGYEYTMALKGDSTLWSWGTDGVLGNMSSIDRHVPTRIGADTWTRAVAGVWNTIAQKSDGTLWAWGGNLSGALGDGTTEIRHLPTLISTDTNWAKLFNGSRYTLAIKSDGKLWGWGGWFPDLANLTPAQIGVDTDWVTVAAGNRHTVALKSDGTLWAWGGPTGAGDDTTTIKGVAMVTAKSGAGGVIASDPSGIDCGSTCTALFSQGSSVTLTATPGSNSTFIGWSGGDCTGTAPCTVTMTSARSVTANFVTNRYELAVTKAGTGNGTVTSAPPGISCGTACSFSFDSGTSVTLTATPDANSTFTGWSGGGCSGIGTCTVTMNTAQTVTATFTPKHYPLAVVTSGAGTGTVTSSPSGIDCGSTCSSSYEAGSTITITAVAAAGSNFLGWSGGGCTGAGPCSVVMSEAKSITATFIPSDPGKWTSLVAGWDYTAALKSDGSLWAWGYNLNGQLGNGTYESSEAPRQIAPESRWIAVAAGEWHMMGLKPDGTLWGWGYNWDGQLGDGTLQDRDLPVQIAPGATWLTVSAGQDHTVAIKSDGTLWAWGWGSTIDGTGQAIPTPTQIGSDSDWLAISAGYEYTMALKADGTLWGWGSNASGFLGDGTTTTRHVPTRIGNDKWIRVVAGIWHTVAQKADGTLWAWGANLSGGLGDGTTVSRHVPTQISTDTDWSTLFIGYGYTMAIKSDGTLWGWGGWFLSHTDLTPTRIGVDTDWVSIAAGNRHTVALKSDGTLWAWGGPKGAGDDTTTIKGVALVTPKSGTGGVITSSPPGIDCGSTCNALFSHGTSVTLTAIPDSRSRFTGWTGACTESEPSCTVAMNESLAVTANFLALGVPEAPTDLVATAGVGESVVTFTAPASDGGSPITSYTVTASPGGITATGPSSPITVSGLSNSTPYTFNVAATNAQGTGAAAPASTLYGLSVTIDGTGSGSVNSAPSRISGTSGTFSGHFDSGSAVSLMQSASNGSQFSGWGGACTGTGECGIVMDALYKAVTATFNVLPRARISGSPTWYGLLKAAYGDAAAGAVILAKETTFAEQLIFDAAKAVTLKGGFDESLSSRRGFTDLDGALLLRRGKLVVDHVKIK